MDIIHSNSPDPDPDRRAPRADIQPHSLETEDALGVIAETVCARNRPRALDIKMNIIKNGFNNIEFIALQRVREQLNILNFEINKIHDASPERPA